MYLSPSISYQRLANLVSLTLHPPPLLHFLHLRLNYSKANHVTSSKKNVSMCLGKLSMYR